jgi:type III restriction enzyme
MIVAANNEEKAASYEAHVSKGFTTLRDNTYSIPANESARDFRAPVTERQDIRRMLFGGFKKCLYRVQKFDSDPERRFAALLESDKKVLKWFRPGKDDLHIHHSGESSYEPDFVVETTDAKLICEVKSAAELEDAEVLAKARAASDWCHHATDHAKAHGGKPWSYLLIPHDRIADNMALAGLVAAYSVARDGYARRA